MSSISYYVLISEEEEILAVVAAAREADLLYSIRKAISEKLSVSPYSLKINLSYSSDESLKVKMINTETEETLNYYVILTPFYQK